MMMHQAWTATVDNHEKLNLVQEHTNNVLGSVLLMKIFTTIMYSLDLLRQIPLFFAIS